MHMHGTLVVRACVYAGFYGLVCVLVCVQFVSWSSELNYTWILYRSIYWKKVIVGGNVCRMCALSNFHSRKVSQ